MESTKHVKLSIMAAFNILSLTTLDSFMERVMLAKDAYTKHRMYIDFPYVRNPKFLDARIATPEMIDKYFLPVIDKVENRLTPYEVYRFKRLYENYINLANNPSRDTDIVRYNFYEYITEYDKRRNKDFHKTFPQYEEFFNLCKNSINV